MKHIIFLCEFGSLNGGERSLLAVLPFLLRGGIDVGVVAPAAGEFALKLRELGITHLHLPFTASDLPELKRSLLTDLLQRQTFDILHANSLSMGCLSGDIVERLSLASVAHLRDMIKLSPPKIASLNRHRRLLAVSNAVRQFHVAQGITSEKCGVLYNGVDLQQFSSEQNRCTGIDLHTELGIASDVPLIAVIGQICLRKGLDTLFDAVENVFRRRELPHLLVVGKRWSVKTESIEYERQLHERAAVFPLAGRVHFLGERDDVPRLLRELTLLVHTPRQEPLGRVLLEAAAAGCCVVATDVGGTREIFQNGENEPIVPLVPANDVEKISNEIIRLLDSTELRRTISMAMKNRAEMFAAEKSATRLMEMYEEF
ncbi:MAG: glycosyltransferase family 4 protein [Planctomycetaceae bacterium]|nr:glycosyltransferase family 4 protein [Planctomycetaceae bacterium]